jgi:hypothetical protein
MVRPARVIRARQLRSWLWRRQLAVRLVTVRRWQHWRTRITQISWITWIQEQKEENADDADGTDYADRNEFICVIISYL